MVRGYRIQVRSLHQSSEDDLNLTSLATCACLRLEVLWQGIQKMHKEQVQEQLKLDSNRRTSQVPSVPKALSDRPSDTLVTLEQEKSEVTS